MAKKINQSTSRKDLQEPKDRKRFLEDKHRKTAIKKRHEKGKRITTVQNCFKLNTSKPPSSFIVSW